MRLFARRVGFITSFVVLFSLAGSGVVFADGTSEAPVHVIAESTTVTSHGAIHARLIPAAEHKAKHSTKFATPDSGYAVDGGVEETIDGSGWYMNSWQIEGGPIEPGECTYSAYWFPSETIAFYGDDICNDTSQEAWYQSTEYGVQVTGDAYACGTVVLVAGKPCIWVWQ